MRINDAITKYLNVNGVWLCCKPKTAINRHMQNVKHSQGSAGFIIDDSSKNTIRHDASRQNNRIDLIYVWEQLVRLVGWTIVRKCNSGSVTKHSRFAFFSEIHFFVTKVNIVKVKEIVSENPHSSLREITTVRWLSGPF
jgi:hypothetical protein